MTGGIPVNMTSSELSLLQIWRFLTCLLWYPVNFRWLMMLYFLYSYSQRLETGFNPHTNQNATLSS